MTNPALRCLAEKARWSRVEKTESAYEVAVDIGTTTIAMELIGCDSGQVQGTAAFINSQRLYGADVITRMKASMDGKKKSFKSISGRICAED